jgi:hypothetical protein
MDTEDVDAMESDLRPYLGDFVLCISGTDARSSCVAFEEAADGAGTSDEIFRVPEIEDETSLPSAMAGTWEDASRFCSCEP